jgi:hypothetical protein
MPHSTIPGARSVVRRSARVEGGTQARTIGHDRLVTILTGTQLAVGLFAAARIASRWLPPNDARDLVTAGAVVLLSALLVGHGRRGERTADRTAESSVGPRLTVVLLVLGAVTVASLASAWLVGPSAESSTLYGTADVIIGLAAVWGSGMALTAREPRGPRAARGAHVLGTTAVLGAGTLALVSSAEAARPLAAACTAALVVVTMLKLVGLHRLFCFEAGRDALPLVRMSHLLRGKLRSLVALRVVSGVLGGIVLPVVSAAAGGVPILAMLALELCLVGEGTEYALVFRAGPPPPTTRAA